MSKSYQEAINGENADDWTSAIQEELQAHQQNATWITIDKSPGQHLLTTKWVFANKTNDEGL